jgi:ABC-type multidrug transport system fused ATPase/permease subunit
MQGQRLQLRHRLCSAWFFATAANYLVPLVGAATIDHAIGSKDVSAGQFRWSPPGAPRGGRNRDWLREPACGSPRCITVMLTALGGAGSYFKGRYTSLASDGIARRLKDDLYDHLNHLPARTARPLRHGRPGPALQQRRRNGPPIPRRSGDGDRQRPYPGRNRASPPAAAQSAHDGWSRSPLSLRSSSTATSTSRRYATCSSRSTRPRAN